MTIETTTDSNAGTYGACGFEGHPQTSHVCQIAGSPVPPAVDAKGRRMVDGMSADECARETLAIARALQDLVENFFADMQSGKLELPGPLGMLAKFMR
jgi:hypothetical protein